MCRSEVIPEAEHALAELLADIARALDPEHPELVRIGPVDFGAHDFEAEAGGKEIPVQPRPSGDNQPRGNE